MLSALRTTGSPVRRITVVIPACNEAAVIRDSLAGVWAAAAELPPAISVEVVVVANGCTDETAEAARAAGAVVITQVGANVGSARRAGVDWALRNGADDLWIAGTDADTLVPPHWLTAQVAAAADGTDVFLGTVALDSDAAARHQGWLARYTAQMIAAPEHGHIHGANLGFRATSYVTTGGFRALPAHEDVDLVQRLLASGATPAWRTDVPVTTSARHDPRVPEGVGMDLAASD